jgi:hypothetical protein
VGVNLGCGHRELYITQATSIRKNAYITWSVQVGYLGLRNALEFVHSAAKRSSDSRPSALLWGRSESGLAYPLHPDSSLSSPQHTDLHKIPARQPAVAPCAKNHLPVQCPRGFTTQQKIKTNETPFLHPLARGYTTQIKVLKKNLCD